MESNIASHQIVYTLSNDVHVILSFDTAINSLQILRVALRRGREIPCAQWSLNKMPCFLKNNMYVSAGSLQQAFFTTVKISKTADCS